MHEDHLSTLWEQAIRDEQAGRLLQARDGYAEVVQLQSDLHGLVHPHVLERIALVLIALRQFEPAHHFLFAAQQILAQRMDGYGVFRMKVQLANLLVSAGVLEGAAETLAALEDERGPFGPPVPERAEELARRLAAASFPRCAPADLAVARTEACCALARLWIADGRFRPASKLARQALSVSPAGMSWISRPDVALLLAEACLYCGDLPAVLDLERRFAAAGDPAAALRWELFRARREMMLGQLGAAKRRLRSALDAARGAGVVAVEERAARALAELLALINRLEDAEALLDEAAARLQGEEAGEAYRRAFDQLRTLIAKRREAAVAHDLALPFLPELLLKRKLGKRGASGPEPAEEREAPAVREPFLDEAASRINRVLIRLHDERLDDAAEEVDALVAWAARSDSPIVAMRVELAAALVRYCQGDHPAAREALERSADRARQLGLVQDEWQAQRVLAWACAQLEDSDAYTRHSRRAKELLDALSSSLDAEDRVFFLLNKWSAQDEYLCVKVSTIAAAPEPSLPFAGLRRWVHRRRLERRTLEAYRELSSLTGWDIERKLDPEAGAEDLSARTPPEVESWVARHIELLRAAKGTEHELSVSDWMLWRIPRNVAILQFHAIADRLFVFLLWRRRIAYRVMGVSKIVLEQAARDVVNTAAASRFRAPRAGGDHPFSIMTSLLGLDQILDELPRGVDRLVVIPHDALTNLPFAALWLGDAYLCERFALSCLPRLRGFHPRAYRARAPAQVSSFVGVGVTRCRGAPTSLPDLDHAVPEVEAAAAVVKAARETLLRDGEARSPHVLEALESAAWVHLSSHGSFDAESPHRSCFWLAGDDDRPDAISLADIMRRDLRKLDVAVLACCWLSSAAVLPGSEAICMPASFLRAGARAVIAPIWEVADERGRDFMSAVYGAILEAGPARGLAEAQRAFIRDGRLPYHWASYTMYGNG